MNNNVLDSTIWGPPTWYLLHHLAYSYDPNLKKYYTNFFEHFKNLIPCEICKKSYNNYIIFKPVNLNSKEEFINWTIYIHNIVNNKLSKKYYTREEVNNIYQSFDNKQLYNFFSTFLSSSLLLRNNLSECKKLFENLSYIYPDKSKREKILKILKSNKNPENPLQTKLLMNFLLAYIKK